MTATWERVLPIRRRAARVARVGHPARRRSRSRSLVWPFPAPLGVIVNGALVGGRIALIALGIALVYRANRVINFAAADLGAAPGTLAVLLVLSLGWNYWLERGHRPRRRDRRSACSSRRSSSGASTSRPA